MSPLLKNLQKFFIFFFTATSLVLIVLGINRAKKPASLTEQIPESPNMSSTSTTTNTDGVAIFTGKPYRTEWGNAVASVQIQNGKLVGVTMPSVPNSPPSIYAEPYLIDQALKSGGANIQGVSGATYTSIAFKSSLESALAKAADQGQTVTIMPSGSDIPASTKPAVPRQYRDDDDDDDDWF